jgi:hypothetical protein
MPVRPLGRPIQPRLSSPSFPQIVPSRPSHPLRIKAGGGCKPPIHSPGPACPISVTGSANTLRPPRYGRSANLPATDFACAGIGHRAIGGGRFLHRRSDSKLGRSAGMPHPDRVRRRWSFLLAWPSPQPLRQWALIIASRRFAVYIFLVAYRLQRGSRRKATIPTGSGS